jgi:hypothetical protein
MSRVIRLMKPSLVPSPDFAPSVKIFAYWVHIPALQIDRLTP